MKYMDLTLGQVEAIVNKLGGMEGVKRFLSGETVTKETEYEIGVWKTIKLGTGLKTAEDFRRALRDNKVLFNEWTSDILEDIVSTVSAEEAELDLVKITAQEFGFKKNAQRDQIYKCAKKFGLKLCSPEVGPQLCLQYQELLNNERVIIAMEPIIDSIGDFNLFVVERKVLGCDWRSPDDLWLVDDQWIFWLPRK